MPSSEQAVVARPLKDVSHEERFIPSLYPHECLDQPTNSLDTDAAAAVPASSLTYQNMGVQTLPPANGNIFKQIHGREPSQRDYVRRMGSAGIGRFVADPRLNHYDLIYDAAYPAPTTAPTETYADSGFQTASHDKRRKALARAKVKASVTATKYRDAALLAGYVVCAESRDELIAHSEQFSRPVQLNAEGNLLEGTVKTRSLPNILGASVLHTNSAPRVSRRAADPCEERFPRHARHDDQAAVPEQAPRLFPAQPLNPRAQVVKKKHRNPAADVPARNPLFSDLAWDADLVLEGEYGSAKSEMNEHITYNPGTEHGRPAQSSGCTASSPKKRKSKADLPSQPPPMGPQTVASILLQSSFDSVATLINTFLEHRDRDVLLRMPVSDHKASKGSMQLALSISRDGNEQSALTAVQSDAPSGVGSGSIVFRPINAPRLQEFESHRGTLIARSVGGLHVIARTGEGHLLRARDVSPYCRPLGKPKPSQALQYTPDAPVAADLFEVADIQLHPELASQRRKRSFDQTGIEPAEIGTERLGRNSSSNQQDKGSFQEKLTPGKLRDVSLDPPTATEASASRGTHQIGSARVERNTISRASRERGQTIMPYVPPAMRARGRKDDNAEEKR